MTPPYALRSQSRWTGDNPWPRRLLHVPSMTSCPWKPGNRYGGRKEPTYNAISYTWGRFVLKEEDAEYSSTEPLPVKGLHWPVPRVNPVHFTQAQFQHIINISSQHYDVHDDDEFQPAEFIWLDVACIDQSFPRTAEYYSEIGRQAKIFRGAQEVVAWLTTFDGARMSTWWNQLKMVEEPVAGVEVGNPPSMELDLWLEGVRALLTQMRAEPWFTSLWTLQEAFLSPKATIFCKDGRHRDQFGRIGSSRVRTGLLIDFIYRWTDVLRRLKSIRIALQFHNLSVNPEDISALENDIRGIGILDAARLEVQQFRIFEKNDFISSTPMGNPLALLASSHNRECYHVDDRVRGIMQVFDLRLGESSPNAIPGKTYSLPELEDELGNELLLKYPISSHMIVQDVNCQARKAWRVNSRSTLIEEAHSLWRQVVDQGAPGDVERDTVLASNGARLSPETFEGVNMLSFQGQFTRMETFLDVLGDLLGYFTPSLHLDTQWLREMETSLSESDAHLVPQRFKWLTARFKQRNLGVLYLARIRPPPRTKHHRVDYCDWMIGLVVCFEEGRTDVYQRIGVAILDFPHLRELMKQKGQDLRSTDIVSDAYEYLSSCTGQGWNLLSGHLG